MGLSVANEVSSAPEEQQRLINSYQQTAEKLVDASRQWRTAYQSLSSGIWGEAATRLMRDVLPPLDASLMTAIRKFDELGTGVLHADRLQRDAQSQNSQLINQFATTLNR